MPEFEEFQENLNEESAVPFVEPTSIEEPNTLGGFDRSFSVVNSTSNTTFNTIETGTNQIGAPSSSNPPQGSSTNFLQHVGTSVAYITGSRVFFPVILAFFNTHLFPASLYSLTLTLTEEIAKNPTENENRFSIWSIPHFFIFGKLFPKHLYSITESPPATTSGLPLLEPLPEPETEPLSEAEVESLRALTSPEIAARHNKIVATDRKLVAQYNKIVATDRELTATDREIVAQYNELAATDRELTATDRELVTKYNEIAATDRELTVADRQIVSEHEGFDIGNTPARQKNKLDLHLAQCLPAWKKEVKEMILANQPFLLKKQIFNPSDLENSKFLDKVVELFLDPNTRFATRLRHRQSIHFFQTGANLTGPGSLSSQEEQRVKDEVLSFLERDDEVANLRDTIEVLRGRDNKPGDPDFFCRGMSDSTLQDGLVGEGDGILASSTAGELESSQLSRTEIANSRQTLENLSENPVDIEIETSLEGSFVRNSDPSNTSNTIVPVSVLGVCASNACGSTRRNADANAEEVSADPTRQGGAGQSGTARGEEPGVAAGGVLGGRGAGTGSQTDLSRAGGSAGARSATAVLGDDWESESRDEVAAGGVLSGGEAGTSFQTGLSRAGGSAGEEYVAATENTGSENADESTSGITPENPGGVGGAARTGVTGGVRARSDNQDEVGESDTQITTITATENTGSESGTGWEGDSVSTSSSGDSVDLERSFGEGIDLFDSLQNRAGDENYWSELADLRPKEVSAVLARGWSWGNVGSAGAAQASNHGTIRVLEQVGTFLNRTLQLLNMPTLLAEHGTEIQNIKPTLEILREQLEGPTGQTNFWRNAPETVLCRTIGAAYDACCFIRDIDPYFTAALEINAAMPGADATLGSSSTSRSSSGTFVVAHGTGWVGSKVLKVPANKLRANQAKRNLQSTRIGIGSVGPRLGTDSSTPLSLSRNLTSVKGLKDGDRGADGNILPCKCEDAGFKLDQSSTLQDYENAHAELCPRYLVALHKDLKPVVNQWARDFVQRSPTYDLSKNPSGNLSSIQNGVINVLQTQKAATSQMEIIMDEVRLREKKAGISEASSSTQEGASTSQPLNEEAPPPLSEIVEELQDDVQKGLDDCLGKCKEKRKVLDTFIKASTSAGASDGQSEEWSKLFEARGFVLDDSQARSGIEGQYETMNEAEKEANSKANGVAYKSALAQHQKTLADKLTPPGASEPGVLTLRKYTLQDNPVEKDHIIELTVRRGALQEMRSEKSGETISIPAEANRVRGLAYLIEIGKQDSSKQFSSGPRSLSLQGELLKGASRSNLNRVVQLHSQLTRCTYLSGAFADSLPLEIRNSPAFQDLQNEEAKVLIFNSKLNTIKVAKGVLSFTNQFATQPSLGCVEAQGRNVAFPSVLFRMADCNLNKSVYNPRSAWPKKTQKRQTIRVTSIANYVLKTFELFKDDKVLVNETYKLFSERLEKLKVGFNEQKLNTDNPEDQKSFTLAKKEAEDIMTSTLETLENKKKEYLDSASITDSTFNSYIPPELTVDFIDARLNLVNAFKL